MATKRPANVTLFGTICNRIPNAMFMVAQSTNQHDVVRFLKSIREKITQAEVESDSITHIVLDNHVAHKTRMVRDYIEEDFAHTGHRFALTFQPPYSCQFNSQEFVWAQVKRRYRQLVSALYVDISQDAFANLVMQSALDCNLKAINLMRCNNKFLTKFS